jgi:bis(5'-nucleosyl)-tetraphosphatase (symmetrical)
MVYTVQQSLHGYRLSINMAKYAIGDIQGCYTQLMKLLTKINYNPSIDTLYLVGDLVNRGHESLKVLNWAYKNQDSIVTVLGNHDIYLLRRYHSTVKPDSDETIQDILSSSDCKKLIEWLKCQPLIFHDDHHIVVHAGIYPKLNFNTLLEICDLVSEELQAKNPTVFLDSVFGNKPALWSDDLEPLQKMKFAINCCTRMRFLNVVDCSLDYKYKGDLINMPDLLIPWFTVDFDPSINKQILFGHWASLGFFHTPKFISLDTGCVWGRSLTAINLDSFEIFQV